MQKHYVVVQMSISIYDFHADDDQQAIQIAEERFGEYDKLICLSDGEIREVGGENV
jgi:hypothetical protein